MILQRKNNDSYQMDVLGWWRFELMKSLQAALYSYIQFVENKNKITRRNLWGVGGFPSTLDKTQYRIATYVIIAAMGLNPRKICVYTASF